MFPVTSHLPPAWVLPAILEELATAMSDLEALGMCLQRLREEGGRVDDAEAVRLWAFAEEVRSFAAEIRGQGDSIARHLVDSFLTPNGWPLEADEEASFREALDDRRADLSRPR